MMSKTTQYVLAAGAIVLVGYFIWKGKTPSTNNTVEKKEFDPTKFGYDPNMIIK